MKKNDISKMKTLDDIARLCNVSPSTISRVLNNEPGISMETRNRVMDTCAAHDFTLQKRKRSLKRAQLQLVIVIPDEDERRMNPFFDVRELLVAINDTFGDERKKIEIVTFRDFALQVTEETFHCDGLILAFGSPETGAMEIIRGRSIPSVFLNRDIPGENYVCANNIKGMLKLGNYLHEAGYIRVGWLGCSSKVVNRDRYRGYMMSRIEAGSSIDKKIIREVDAVGDINSETVSFFMDAQCDAVMCFNDSFGIRLVNEMQQMGLKVPVDMAVTGFDRAPMRDLIRPELTTVDLSTYELGFFASRWLRDVILHRTDRRLHLEVEGELVPGKTVKRRKDHAGS